MIKAIASELSGDAEHRRLAPGLALDGDCSSALNTVGYCDCSTESIVDNLVPLEDRKPISAIHCIAAGPRDGRTVR